MRRQTQVTKLLNIPCFVLITRLAGEAFLDRHHQVINDVIVAFRFDANFVEQVRPIQPGLEDEGLRDVEHLLRVRDYLGRCFKFQNRGFFLLKRD